MFAPGATGSGASPTDRVSAGDDVTVVVTAAPATAAVSAQSIEALPFVMIVPLASGLATRTTIWTEPLAPAATLPIVQVTVLPERVPPAVADTKVVFAGSASVSTTTVAPPWPPLVYASV